MLDMPHFTQYVDDTQSVDPLGTAAVIEALYKTELAEKGLAGRYKG
ncbi:hypothetical protein KTE13_20395 [Burkholderia multivorans]|nr:hypothetical protein [Burkholderia multivorans]MBU9402104.1 hypothetical protein [Burkholderia multivorans]